VQSHIAGDSVIWARVASSPRGRRRYVACVSAQSERIRFLSLAPNGGTAAQHEFSTLLSIPASQHNVPKLRIVLQSQEDIVNAPLNIGCGEQQSFTSIRARQVYRRFLAGRFSTSRIRTNWYLIVLVKGISFNCGFSIVSIISTHYAEQDYEVRLECWNAHDIEGHMDVYWNSPELLVIVDSEEYNGRQQLHDSYIHGYPATQRMESVNPAASRSSC
jgi:hypothetical protein